MSDRAAAANTRGKLIIGLTGNIATGKSAVTQLAAEKGALTIDADKVVHEIMDSDPNMQAAIAVAFGSEVRRADGRIDRRVLGNVVFNDPDALRDLEEMVHPPVRVEAARRIAESDAAVVFIEAIKLLEGDWAGDCHQIWVTRCSRQRQLQRLMVCRGMDAESAATRINAQPPQEEKVAQADVVIDTDGLMKDTETQFEMAWDRLPDPATVTPKPLSVPPPPPKPKPKPETKPEPAPPVAVKLTPAPAPEAKTDKPKSKPAKLQARRARPSDIPAVLLHIQKATGGAVKMKRTELLLALSERSYFIGQIGAAISTVMGWNIDSQIARIDEIFIYPLAAAAVTGTAVLEEILKSANSHLCEIIVAFLPDDAPGEIRPVFDANGYTVAEKESLPRVWQRAIEESQPENTFFMIRILRDDRLTR